MPEHRIESTTRMTRTIHVVEFHTGDPAVAICREFAKVPATARLTDIVRDSDYDRAGCVLTFEATEEDKGEPR